MRRFVEPIVTTEPLEKKDREQPFFTAVLDDGIVYKYEPGTAAVAAVGRATIDQFWLGFAIVFALLGPVVWGLTRELTRSDPISVIAALVVALSPVSLMQGSFTLAVIPWFRQYEPLISIAVFTAYLLAIEGRRILPRLAKTAAVAAAGVLPLLATNLAMTGSVVPPLVRHFTDDRLGCGHRRATLEWPFIEYRPADALESMVDGWAYLAQWSIGGPLLLLAGLAGPIIMPRRLALLLGGLLAAVTLANALFWGTFNAIRLGTYEQVGPFYQLPLLLPVGIGAGYTLLWLHQRRRTAVAVTIVAVGAVWGAYLLRPGFDSLDSHQERVQAQDDQVAVLDEPALVMLDSESTLFPFRKLRNTTSDPAVLYQLGREDLESLPLPAENPERQPYQMVTRLVFDDSGRLVGNAAVEPLIEGASVVQSYDASCGQSGGFESMVVRVEGADLGPDEVTLPCPGAVLSLQIDDGSVSLSAEDQLITEGPVSTDTDHLVLTLELPGADDRVVHTEHRVIERDPKDGKVLMPGRPVVENGTPLRGYLLLRPKE